MHGIPVLKCFKQEHLPKPLVILSHGFTANKENWISQLMALAQHGYYAVALDNRAHGERMEPDFLAQVYAGSRLKLHVVRRLMKETADDVSRLIDHLIAVPEIDPNRIAMSGVSMGGFTTFRALVIEPRITVAAPIIASPFWDDIPAGVAVAEDAESRQALTQISQQYSPALFPQKFPPRAILIQIGGSDGHYNAERVQQFFQQLAADYYRQDAGKIKLIVHEGVGHDFTAAMWNNAMEWFGKYL